MHTRSVIKLINDTRTFDLVLGSDKIFWLRLVSFFVDFGPEVKQKAFALDNLDRPDNSLAFHGTEQTEMCHQTSNILFYMKKTKPF